VLSHPLLVDAAHSLFEPLCIYNNTDGDADATVRKAFEEPAWNNPVVRVVDRERRDVAAKVTRDWSVAAVAELMVASLRALERPVPRWLELLAAEQRSLAAGVERAVFGMG